MGFNNSKVLALINAIKAQILGDVEDKIEDHDVIANSSRTGHVQAGGSPQDINLSGTSSPGTDNGYYARADHVHKISTNSSNSGKYLKVDTNGSIICDVINTDNDYGTFAELQTLINNANYGDIIILDKNYVNNGNESEIVINDWVAICGNGHTIDANNKSRIFNISYECILSNICFKNGSIGSGSGGAIYSNTSVTIANCEFGKNTAPNGGAIAVGYNSNIYNCTFHKNRANTYGGAIYSTSDITIDNCIIHNNSVMNNGGGIYNTSNNCRIINCNIRGNTNGSPTNFKDNVYSSTALIIYNCNVSDGLTNCTNKNYLTSSDISGKADITQSITNGDTTHSPSADIIYDTLIDSNSTTKNGHTHNYATSNDISSSISTHNSSSSAHQDLFSQYATLEDIASLNHQIIEEIPFYWVDDFLTYASSSHNVFYDPNSDVQYLVEFIDSNDNDSGFTSDDIKTDRLYQIPYGSSYSHDICVAFTYDEVNEEYNAHYVTTNERYATLYELSLKANSSAIPTIADNLSTNSSTQVLSAKQGKVLNDLIGNISTIINGNGS